MPILPFRKRRSTSVSEAESVPQQVMDHGPASPGPPAEPGFPDPYRLLADARKVLISKEVTAQSRAVNCLVGLCGITRYRYFVRDASTGKDLFKAKFSYSASCHLCVTRHNYSLDLFCLPLSGGATVGAGGAFLAASSSATSAVASGGHGVMDMRSKETLGRVIPAPTGSFSIKEGVSGPVSFRVAVPVNTGYGAKSSEMLIEDGATTALVGRMIKTWTQGDSWCVCSSEQPGSFLLDMSAVTHVKKRALLVVAAILADGVSYNFRAAPAHMRSVPKSEPSSPTLKKLLSP